MLSYERKKNSTIGDGHPDSKFANELGALMGKFPENTRKKMV